MNKLRFSACAALLTGAMSMGLQAQEAGPSVGASLLTGAGRTSDVVGLKSGLTLSAAYTFETSQGIKVRPGFSLGMLVGSGVQGVTADADDRAANNVPYNIPGSSLKHTFNNIQLSSDILVPIFNNRANWIIGLSLNKYSVKVSGAAKGQYSPVDLDAATRSDATGSVVRTGDANGTTTIPGYKFGLRAGVDYKLNSNVSLQVLFQQTEMGRIFAKQGQLPTLNPAWLEFGVNYRF
jgi:hypothetical protein